MIHKRINKQRIQLLKYCSLIVATLTLGSCTKFLDVVPDDVATIEHAFSNRFEAEKFLHTCYSYPFSRGGGDPVVANIMFMGGDEMWTYNGDNYRLESPWKIALGEQNKVNPFVNAWDGLNHAKPTFKAIRDCNIFLENIQDESKVLDLDPQMRQRWIAEVKFLKAYYHFVLLRMYGPIPIVDKNLPISASPAEVKVKRDTFDDVVNYIASLLDEAASVLPAYIENQSTEAGRATSTAALMLKTRLLVMAASPLFNGNPDYANFKDHDGIQLISSTYDASKWQRAVDAGREALNAAEQGGYSLYEFTGSVSKISDSTRIQMNIRGAVTEKWNSEFIWGFTDHQETAVAGIQNGAMAGQIDHRLTATPQWTSYLSVTMRVAELFYSDNGVPITEDRDWDYNNRFELATATHADRYNIIQGFTTARLNFNRENRFYGSVAFDGAKWFMQNSPNQSDDNTDFYVHGKFGQNNGKLRDQYYNVTGYWPKKLVNWKYTQTNAGSYTTEKYPRPEMRLADLYLLYAEALNEVGNGTEAIVWLDKVRMRAGLDGVLQSWADHSINPTKPTTTDGLREIVHQERLIEMAFEGSRIWDLRRWKKAEILQNTPIKGWDINGRTDADYYRVKVLHNMEFVAPRDYLWPIMESNLTVNSNLVQNPGW